MLNIIGGLRAIFEAIARVAAYLRDRQLRQACRDAERVDTLTEGQRRVQEANRARIRVRNDPDYRDKLRDKYRDRADE